MVVYRLEDEEFEKFFLDKWSRAKKMDNASPNSLSSLQVQRSVQTTNIKESQLDEVKKNDTNGLSSSGISLLQVHGCIHQEQVIVSINPSYTYSFINVHLAKKIASFSKAHLKHIGG